MKSTYSVHLIKVRTSAQEYDDREDYVAEDAIVELRYSHFWINKKRQLLKRCIELAKNIAGYPYTVTITDKSEYKDLPKIIDGFTVAVAGKIYTGSIRFSKITKEK